MLVCLNGHFIPREEATVAISNGGFLYGDTLFETLKARGKKILLVWQHLDRLEDAARLLDFPIDRERIERSLHELEAGLSAPVSRIRLTLSRGNFSTLTWPATEEAHYLLTAVPYTEPDDARRETGATCVLAPNRRVNPLSHLPQVKRGNYADCLYAYNHAHTADADEALFSDEEGNLLEGSTSNIFALIDQRLVTPPCTGLVLDGIMRRQVIAAAAELGIPVSERPLPVTELLTADEAFLTNSLIDILPLATLDGQPLNRGDGWKSLLKTLRVRIET
ncbi:MAG: hypothetical protein C0622_06675 [Desulfuromonas sp.]|nr:MAG: hypothetical protein C0622_06675 [Desulfuromonas sp.]